MSISRRTNVRGAPVLHRVLGEAARAISAGQSPDAVLQASRGAIEDAGFALDYLELRDAGTLGPAAAGADAGCSSRRASGGRGSSTISRFRPAGDTAHDLSERCADGAESPQAGHAGRTRAHAGAGRKNRGSHLLRFEFRRFARPLRCRRAARRRFHGQRSAGTSLHAAGDDGPDGISHGLRRPGRRHARW